MQKNKRQEQIGHLKVKLSQTVWGFCKVYQNVYTAVFEKFKVYSDQVLTDLKKKGKTTFLITNNNHFFRMNHFFVCLKSVDQIILLAQIT